MITFDDLKQQLQYLSLQQIKEISKAYKLAEKLHRGQVRSSGEPYITHPLAVATILAELHMDHQVIMTAMLHDVLEDSEVTKEDLAALFNPKIAELVDGVSKLDQLTFASKEEAQAENLRKMILAMAKDIKVIIVKLADRLHNMRTLEAKSLEHQKRIALETLEIYAPIANRLGMNNFCTEFEDRGFCYLYPVRYKVLKNAVSKVRGNRKEIVQNLEKSIITKCKHENILSKKVFGREKPLYSLYKKMKLKNLSLYEVMDVYAIRIIVENANDCYRVLGAIHNLYKPIHNRFKDYIAVPKVNGYQSLHTAVIGPHGVPVEVQIRTESMDKTAENGIAAHWLYKTNNNVSIQAQEWFNSILEIQQNSDNSLEFIEHMKVDLYPGEVYVFTPTGDIMSLSNSATCVDFAYAVHTDIGHSCIAAKIDRRLVPVSTRLANGQTVEIITANGAHPNPLWLNFVSTAKARSNIKNWLKNKKNIESIALGKKLLERALVELDYKDGLDSLNYLLILKELHLQTKEELLMHVGLGKQLAPLVARKLLFQSENNKTKINSSLVINGTEGMVINYAKCCHPIPGDSIIGIFNVGRGIIIHKEDCKFAIDIQNYPEKYIFVTWNDNVIGFFSLEIQIEALSQKNLITEIVRVLADFDASIEYIKSKEDSNRRLNIFLFKIQVSNVKHLNKIIKKLYIIDAITNITRL